MKNLVINCDGNNLNHNLIGLFAFVNNMVSSIWFNRENINNVNFFYDIVGNSPYYDDQILFTNNVWEYFFYPPANILYSELDKKIETIYGPWNKFNNGNNLVSEFQVNPKIMQEKKEKLKEISKFIFNNGSNRIILRDEIYELVKQTKNRLGLNKTKYISVHYRYFTWDENKIYNPHQSREISYQHWFDEIEKVIDDDTKIFLATDNIESVNIFKEKYGEKLIYNESVERFSNDPNISHVGDNPHNLPSEYLWAYKTLALSTNRKQSPYETGLQAIIDCWILSGGSTIIKIFSGLGFFSTLINPEINIINLDTIY